MEVTKTYFEALSELKDEKSTQDQDT